MFGLGIVYTILLPFVVVYFAIFLVYTFVNYLVCEVYTAVSFFFGGGCSLETKLDKELIKKRDSLIPEISANTEGTYAPKISPVEVPNPVNDEGGIF